MSGSSASDLFLADFFITWATLRVPLFGSNMDDSVCKL